MFFDLLPSGSTANTFPAGPRFFIAKQNTAQLAPRVGIAKPPIFIVMLNAVKHLALAFVHDYEGVPLYLRMINLNCTDLDIEHNI